MQVSALHRCLEAAEQLTFGGLGALDERALLKTYSRVLSDLTGTDIYDSAAVGYAIVHLTWGLHLRLGPGLTAVRLGVHDHSQEQLTRPWPTSVPDACARCHWPRSQERTPAPEAPR